MKKLTRFGPNSVGKVFGATYAVFGLVLGLVLLLISVFSSSEEGKGFGAILFGVGAPIVLPLLYGLFGYLTGVFSAWLYNVVAKRTGGIEFESE